MAYEKVKEWEWCSCVTMQFPKCKLCNAEGKVLRLDIASSLVAAEAEIKRLTALLEEKAK